MTTQAAFASDFARHAGDFGGERTKLLDHGVERFFKLQDFAADVHGDFAGEVAGGDRRGDFRDVTNLSGEVAGHEVDVVGEVFPGATDTGYLRLTAEFSFGSHFAGDAGDFSGEGVELVHHGVDGVFEFENFALHVHRDFARQVAASHCCGDFGDVTNLAGQVAGHGVHVVGEVLPGACNSGDFGLTAELTVGADFAGHAGDFAGEGVELVHHGVDGFFEQKNFAADVDGDFLGEVAAGDGGGDVGDVTHLAGKVAGHGVDRVGEVLPGSRDTGHLCLTA